MEMPINILVTDMLTEVLLMEIVIVALLAKMRVMDTIIALDIIPISVSPHKSVPFSKQLLYCVR